MKQRDLDLLSALAPAVAELINDAVDPLMTRLKAAEKRVIELESTLKTWPKRVDMAVEIAGLVKAAVDQAKAEMTPAKTTETATLELKVDDAELKAAIAEAVAGITVDVEEVGRVVDERLAKAVDALPKAPTAAEVAALVPAPTGPTAAEVSALVAPGKDADPEVIRSMVKTAVDAIPPVDIAPLQAAVNAANAAAVNATTMAEEYKQAIADLPKVPTVEEVRALIPTPENGKSVTLDDVRPVIDAALAGIEEKMEREVRAEIDNGQSMADAIAAAVSKAVDALPAAKPGEDGVSVTLDQLRPLVDETVAKRVAEIPVPKDGVGLAGTLIDRDGELVATLTDGTTKKLGPVVGKDGMGPSDFEMVDDGDGVIYRMSVGDKVKEWRIPKPTMADFFQYGWKDGTEYKRGALVMYGGQPWLAMADTKARPDGNSDWAMFAKKARDGKDGVMLEPKPKPTVKL